MSDPLLNPLMGSHAQDRSDAIPVVEKKKPKPTNDVKRPSSPVKSASKPVATLAHENGNASAADIPHSSPSIPQPAAAESDPFVPETTKGSLNEDNAAKTATNVENSSAAPVFIPLIRDYQYELDQLKPPKIVNARVHPLLPKDMLAKYAKKGSVALEEEPKEDLPPISAQPKSNDPLSLLSSTTFDPLSSSSVSRRSPSPLRNEPRTGKNSTAILGDYETWREKKPKILAQYTTQKKIAVSANFLDDETIEKSNKAVDGTRTRLEELESGEHAHTNSSSKHLLTQKEYISHIEEQHDRLKHAWENGDRVLSLKIAIQCAKLLGDVSVPQFYPSMFVLLTEILDSFGDLVFARIKQKGGEISSPQSKHPTFTSLPPTFTYQDVSVSAKETCKNWFYKTACIRELVPRMYIELCLLKCYRFIEPASNFLNHFQRLSRCLRGIGDPICALYARAYLATKIGDVYMSFHAENCRAGESRHIPSEYQPILIESYDDFVYVFQHFNSDKDKWSSIKCIREDKISVEDYLNLFTPALDFLIQNIGYKATKDVFFSVSKQYKDYSNHAFILNLILCHFPGDYISTHAKEMSTLIKQSLESKYSTHSKLYLALGRCLIRLPPPESVRLPILNEVWKFVSKIPDVNVYVEIAEVFIQFIVSNFSLREVNIFLKDVLKHVKINHAFKEPAIQQSLLNILTLVVNLSESTSNGISEPNDHATLPQLLLMENFVPLLDLLNSDSKQSLAKSILAAFAQKSASTSDPILINTLFELARDVHNSVDSLTYEDENRQLSHLIIGFVQRIDYGRDLEQQLNMFVQCRATFTNLELVIAELVFRVALLCMKAHSLKNGQHTKKTGNFVKACLAYCHITIPSLDDIFLRLRLYLIVAQVALVNTMIVQSEHFIKAAITLLHDVPPYLEINKLQISTEPSFLSYCRSLTSFLLYFPGHPKNGPFYLLNGFLNVIQRYSLWNPNAGNKDDDKNSMSQPSASPGKIRVLIGIASLFCTYAQPKFPSHIAYVQSNDELYGGSPEYMKEVYTYLSSLMSEIFSSLQLLSEKTDLVNRKQCGELALDLINLCVSSLEINSATANLVLRVFQIAKKMGSAVDSKSINSTLSHISSKKSVLYQDLLSQLP